MLIFLIKEYYFMRMYQKSKKKDSYLNKNTVFTSSCKIWKKWVTTFLHWALDISCDKYQSVNDVRKWHQSGCYIVLTTPLTLPFNEWNMTLLWWLFYHEMSWSKLIFSFIYIYWRYFIIVFKETNLKREQIERRYFTFKM